MSLMRHRARNDANHKDITAALRKAGVMFREIKYPADLLVIDYAGHPVFVEIKVSKAKKLTAMQQWLQDNAPGHFLVAITPAQTLEALGYTGPTETDYPPQEVVR
jgi:hypothetical protein